MDSNSKNPKKIARNSSSNDDEEDRLSSLSVSILCHILSFLSTKHAAATSVLSKNWKYIFLDVPKIDLDYSLILHPQQEGSRSTDHYNEDFIEFVNRRLMLCKTVSIDEFRLKCLKLPKPSMINSWITTLLWRDINVLEIQVDRHESNLVFVAPCEIFSCGTLVVLKLCGSKIVLKVPELVQLRNLKVLHLKHLAMQFESSNANVRLAEGFRSLEDLRMDEIRFPMYKVIAISIQTLKKLAIIHLGEFGEELCRIDINTPNLQCFEYYFQTIWDELSVNFTCKCESLVEADLSCSGPIYIFGRISGLVEIFRKMYNVKSLNLSGGFLEVLTDYYSGTLPQFPNLIHMGLTEGNVFPQKSIRILLECAPKCLFMTWPEPKKKGRGVPEVVPQCLAQKLAEIRIKNFEGSKVELQLVRCLLQHGAVLERVIIDRPDNEKSKEWASSIWKQLLKFSRCSRKCEIELT